MKKRRVSVFLIAVLFASIMFSHSMVYAADIKITIDGKTIESDQPPFIMNGRTLVPMRVIFEALDFTVQWNAQEKRVTATRINEKESCKVYLIMDYPEITVDYVEFFPEGNRIALVEHTLDVPAQIVNGRTFVPARAVAEALGCSVIWNGDSHTVVIDTTDYKIVGTTPIYNTDNNGIVTDMVPIKTAEQDTEQETPPPATDETNNEKQRQPITGTAPEVGSQLAKILIDDTVSPYKADGKVNRENFTTAYRYGNTGQCTWYASGRFYEVHAIDSYTDTKLFTSVGKSAGIPLSAWLDNADREDLPSVYSIRDAKGIVAQSIAIWTGDTESTATKGHVVFVEYVEYDAGGNPTEVYFSEANYGNDVDGVFRPNVDGVIKKQSFDDFVTRSVHGTLKGYVAAK